MNFFEVTSVEEFEIRNMNFETEGNFQILNDGNNAPFL